MGITPTDDRDTRTTADRTSRGGESASSLSGRRRLKALLVGVQRYRRSVIARTRAGLNRLLSPGLSSSEQSLADEIVEPPQCPAVEGLPTRAFPLVYPTRSFRFVENEVALEADLGDDTLRISHPATSDTWIESDTWTRVPP